MLLHEQNPELAQDVYEERQIRIREMAFKAALKDDEKKTPYKTRFGSFDDISSVSMTPDRGSRRKSKMARNEPFSPELRPKTSQVDLMFDMDGDEDDSFPSPSPRPVLAGDNDELDRLPSLSTSERHGKRHLSTDVSNTTPTSTTAAHNVTLPVPVLPNDIRQGRPSQGASPWKSSALPASRLDLREILAESQPVHSALSAGLAAQNRDVSSRVTPTKISQKERKRQLQQQAEDAAKQETEARRQSQTPWSKDGEKKDTAWKNTRTATEALMKDLLRPDFASAARPTHPKPLSAAEASSSKSTPRRAASPDTRFPGQKPNYLPNPSTMPVRQDPQPLMPHSKSYIKRAPKTEQETGLPLADIIGQQQREQQSRREAVAKRSLQEIQQEQAFQEWWDQESRRMQEEEARRIAREEGKDKKGGQRRNRGSRNKGKGNNNNNNNNNSNNTHVGEESKSGTAVVPDAGPSNSKGKGRANRGGKK